MVCHCPTATPENAIIRRATRRSQGVPNGPSCYLWWRELDADRNSLREHRARRRGQKSRSCACRELLWLCETPPAKKQLIAYLISPTHASCGCHSCANWIARPRFAVASLAFPEKRFAC